MNTYRDKTTGRYIHSPANRNKFLVNELYRAFDQFNKYFAESKLPPVVITIQNKGRANALGWFGQGFWYDKLTGDGLHEINLSAEHLARGPEQLLETLLHEMAHLYNAVHDIKDCSGGQYHNKRFKIAAEKFGLVVGKLPNRGWAKTHLTYDARDQITKLNLDNRLFVGLRRKRVKQSTKKYTSLIVSEEVYDVVKATIRDSGKSQKQFVEDAILQACKNI